MNSRQLPASYIYHGNPGYDSSVLEQIHCFPIMLKEFLSFGIKTIGKIFKVGFFICTFHGQGGPSQWGCHSASLEFESLKVSL